MKNKRAELLAFDKILGIILIILVLGGAVLWINRADISTKLKNFLPDYDSEGDEDIDGVGDHVPITPKDYTALLTLIEERAGEHGGETKPLRIFITQGSNTEEVSVYWSFNTGSSIMKVSPYKNTLVFFVNHKGEKYLFEPEDNFAGIPPFSGESLFSPESLVIIKGIYASATRSDSLLKLAEAFTGKTDKTYEIVVQGSRVGGRIVSTEEILNEFLWSEGSQSSKDYVLESIDFQLMVGKLKILSSREISRDEKVSIFMNKKDCDALVFKFYKESSYEVLFVGDQLEEGLFDYTLDLNKIDSKLTLGEGYLTAQCVVEGELIGDEIRSAETFSIVAEDPTSQQCIPLSSEEISLIELALDEKEEITRAVTNDLNSGCSFNQNEVTCPGGVIPQTTKNVLEDYMGVLAEVKLIIPDEECLPEAADLPGLENFNEDLTFEEIVVLIREEEAVDPNFQLDEGDFILTQNGYELGIDEEVPKDSILRGEVSKNKCDKIVFNAVHENFWGFLPGVKNVGEIPLETLNRFEFSFRVSEKLKTGKKYKISAQCVERNEFIGEKIYSHEFKVVK